MIVARLTFVTLLVATSPAAAWVQNSAPDGTLLYQRGDHVDFVIDDEVFQAMRWRGVEAIQEAAAEWSRVDGVPELRVYLPEDPQVTDRTNRITWVKDFARVLKKEPNVLAVTTTSWRSTGALAATPIAINADASWEAYSDYIDIYAVDLQGAMTHEFGHALGLEHSDAEGAVMRAVTTAGDLTQRRLTQDDIDGVRAIYDRQAGASEAQSATVKDFGPGRVTYFDCSAGDVGQPKVSGRLAALLFILFLLLRRKLA